MIARLLYERAARPAYDVVAVAWGQGPPVRWLARLTPAQRRIHFQDRHTDLYRERPTLPAEPDLFDAGWHVARMVARDFAKPGTLCIPALEHRYRSAKRGEQVIGVVPFADELRKNFDAHSLRLLLDTLRARYPSARLRIFFNPADRGAGVVRDLALPDRAELRSFHDLRDTGLFHLAAAMGIPATVFFGPTQPWKIVRPEQPSTQTVRVSALGSEHCDVKECERPLCLHQAVASWAAAQPQTTLADTPQACPLRSHPAERLAEITVHEGPRP